MRISAIREDNTVYVDGVPRTVTWSNIMPPAWHAVQWTDNVGHIEFDGPARNQQLTDPALAMLCKSAWNKGMPLGRAEGIAETDVVATARAMMLDQLVIEAAGKDGADPIVVAAASKLAEQQAATDSLALKAEAGANAQEVLPVN